MTDKQEKFVSLSRSYEKIKNEMKEVKLELINSMLELGVGTHFQDHLDKTVFNIVKPAGTFISFDEIGYERTKRSDELKGSLSMKKAQELGYNLK